MDKEFEEIRKEFYTLNPKANVVIKKPGANIIAKVTNVNDRIESKFLCYYITKVCENVEWNNSSNKYFPFHISFYYDKKTNSIPQKKSLETMKKMLDKGLITEKEFKKFDDIFGPVCRSNLKLHTLPKKELEKKFAKFFKIKQIIDLGKTKDCNYKYHPMYVLTK